MIEISQHTGKGFKIEGNRLLFPHWIQEAYLYVQTDSFIAADRLCYDKDVIYYKLHFFIETNGAVQETCWDKLSDDLRLLVRVNARDKIEAYHCEPGGYEDSWYYTLEALL